LFEHGKTRRRADNGQSGHVSFLFHPTTSVLLKLISPPKNQLLYRRIKMDSALNELAVVTASILDLELDSKSHLLPPSVAMA